MKNWFSDRQLTFLIAMNVAIVLLATTFSDGLFIDIDNLQSMGGQVSELGILSIAVMLAMISGNGGIDLLLPSPTCRASMPVSACSISSRRTMRRSLSRSVLSQSALISLVCRRVDQRLDRALSMTLVDPRHAGHATLLRRLGRRLDQWFRGTHRLRRGTIGHRQRDDPQRTGARSSSPHSSCWLASWLEAQSAPHPPVPDGHQLESRALRRYPCWR